MTLKTKKKSKIEIFSDDRGDLCPSSFSNLAFNPKRSFIVYNVPEASQRGAHAHRETEQYLICLNGRIEVRLDNANETKTWSLKKGEALYQNKMEWADLIFKESNSILYVISSTEYDESDYIRDYNTFLQEAAS